MSRIFGQVRQNGYVVRDIEVAMRHWTQVLGLGPFFYFERVPIRERPRPSRRASRSRTPGRSRSN